MQQLVGECIMSQRTTESTEWHCVFTYHRTAMYIGWIVDIMMLASSFRGTLLGQRSGCSFAPARAVSSRRVLVIEDAQKKGAGSTKNGRDSVAKRRGVKVFGGQPVKAGGIIIRQVGSVWHPGQNTDMGRDFTLFSTTDGIVIFDKKKDRQFIHVFPLEHERAQAAVQATHTKKPAEGTQSRRERRLAAYKDKPRRSAVVAAAVPAN